MIQHLQQLPLYLSARQICKRVAVVCGSDASTIKAVIEATQGEHSFAKAIFVGQTDAIRAALSDIGAAFEQIRFVEADSDAEAARLAVALVRNGEADILMKGLVNTDVLLRAVLNKEQGLLPADAVLTHLAVADWQPYDKLLVFSDAAVIPYPTPQQRRAQIGYAARLCRALGIVEPRISLIHCSEKPSEKFPHTLDYALIKEEAADDRWGKIIIDGPLDVRTSCDVEALQTKGISSPIQGRADALIFPDIEAGNTFYKTMTYFAAATTAGILVGTTHPVVLPSRGDSVSTKFNSLCLAAL